MAADGAAIERVTAVVVAWNSGGLAVEQLAALEPAFAAGMRMVLLDNGSVDGSFERMSVYLHDWPHAAHVDLARSDENLGFCAGVNFCVERALAAEPPPDYIWMLNPDAHVSEQTLTEMLAVAELSGQPIVSPGALVGTGNAPPWPRSFWWPPWREMSENRPRWWTAASYHGACAIFSTGLVRSLATADGYFLDPALFMYMDERDVIQRAARFGASVVASRDALVAHSGGSLRAPTVVAAARQYYNSRNRVLVARKHLPHRDILWMLPVRVARDLVWLGRLKFTGQGANLGAYFTGLFDGLRSRTGRWSRHPRANR